MFTAKTIRSSSVFRSELIAIRKGLQFAARADHFQDIWILTDSRASIQHISNWDIVGDQTSLDILDLLDRLSSNHSIHFQRIPSHGGVDGNERADFLAKSAAEEDTVHCGKLTFREISSLAKRKLNKTIRTPPNHSWYFAKKPRESFNLRLRAHQTAFSRFLSGHTRSLTFKPKTLS
ncbi:ribonuclease H-like [Parasteatoda tepidariorum]|uniref:ribonuclease H-like n=1 Tax=Parasteatoda tepidariorum TaxID=114398 RepID=UPI001C728D1A|nr:uncharacterized protein LOC122271602 [Parasteatoda tepidariorum]